MTDFNFNKTVAPALAELGPAQPQLVTFNPHLHMWCPKSLNGSNSFQEMPEEKKDGDVVNSFEFSEKLVSDDQTEDRSEITEHGECVAMTVSLFSWK